MCLLAIAIWDSLFLGGYAGDSDEQLDIYVGALGDTSNLPSAKIDVVVAKDEDKPGFLDVSVVVNWTTTIDFDKAQLVLYQPRGSFASYLPEGDGPVVVVPPGESRSIDMPAVRYEKRAMKSDSLQFLQETSIYAGKKVTSQAGQAGYRIKTPTYLQRNIATKVIRIHWDPDYAKHYASPATVDFQLCDCFDSFETSGIKRVASDNSTYSVPYDADSSFDGVSVDQRLQLLRRVVYWSLAAMLAAVAAEWLAWRRPR